MFLLRAAGDAAGPEGRVAWLSWLSPIGWAHLVRPYAGEQWWLLAPILALAVALFAVAAVLTARRDLGAGMFAARLGRAAAAPRFGSAVALAWRLHRRALTGWTIGFVVIGRGCYAVIRSSRRSSRYASRLL